jgi:aspartyl/asparaginyl beta-hydroxylase (cupin superfamily)
MHNRIDFEKLEKDSFVGMTETPVDAQGLSAEARFGLVKEMIASKRLPVSTHPSRRPAFFYPGLPEKPIYDSRSFPWVSLVQAHAGDFLSELSALEVNQREQAAFHRVWPEFTPTGEWAALWLRLYGEPYLENATLCPKTIAVVDQVPGQGGWLGFSALSAHTHIAPHCGVTNAKLRCHVPLQLTPGASSIRVDDQIHVWKQGEVFVFDDSYEHEVWNPSGEKRVILIFDIYHPDLTAEEIVFLSSMESLTVKQSYNALMRKYQAESTAVPWVYQNT